MNSRKNHSAFVRLSNQLSTNGTDVGALLSGLPRVA